MSEGISDRSRKIIDLYRDHTLMIKSNGKVYVIKFNDSLDIFEESHVFMEYNRNGKIMYLEPKLNHSRKHYSSVDRILEIMEKVELGKENRAKFEKHMLKYA